MPRVLILAGEPSGDILGAKLVESLKNRRDDLEFFSLGGKRLTDTGATTVYPLADTAIMGFVEVLHHLGAIRQARRKVLEFLDREKPDLVIPIDYPGFNIRFSRHAHDRGIPVVYYVSPQVWAWKPGRVERMRRSVTKILVLFPFEVETYERAGIPVECVGHPLMDILGDKRIPDRQNPARGRPFTLGLLPGSRMTEIRRHLPPLIRAADRVARDAGPGRCRCTVIAARELAMADVAGLAAEHVHGAPAIPADLSEMTTELILPADGPLGEVRIVRDPGHEHRAEMHLALTASGTATVENAILGVPTVIVYRVNPLTYLLARRLVRVPYIGMVNLIAEREICPELIQADVTPEKIARTANEILQDEDRWDRMRRDLAAVREKLGAPGASDRAADAVLRVFDG